jgi:RNA polymerase sigma factor (sigma-70 family)
MQDDILTHLPFVKALARTMLPWASRRIALEDLESDGIEGLLQAATRYRNDSEATFKTFAYYRIRGAMLDAQRAAGPIADDVPAELPADAPTAEDELIEMSARVRLRAAVAALPPRERHFIQKHYFEAKPLKTAGEDLGVSKSRASRLHRRALAKLRARMANP